ncbi:hypothetical protein LJC60_01200 [Ruminococcaceae bacterium OttesenSCG-928-D13]|nr:hypothetical protein [Ruminococcaceae bacterium OttesenSCG-928-D13]
MSDQYFIELRNLRFDTPPAGDLPDDLRDALEGWIPRGKGIFTRLENRWTGREQFDYVLITDDIVYYAILSHELQPRLLSLKCFKAGDLAGFAFILAPTEGGSALAGELPQIRLMHRDGKRVRLVLDAGQGAEAMRRMKELSTKNFFTC